MISITPKSLWNYCVPFISPDCKYTSQNEEFSGLLNEFDLKQIMTLPTRNESILDLFLVDNSTLVKYVEMQPGIDKVGKRAKTRNRYNQAPHLTQDTNGNVTNHN